MIKPNKYNSVEMEQICSISSRMDKLGNLFYYVEFYHSSDVGFTAARFAHLSSAMDFITNNLK